MGAAMAGMIVGLGNPGPEYACDRHNIGFQIVDQFAERHGLEFDKFQKRGRLAVGQVSLHGGWAGRVLLAKPMTYMNSSGEAVGPLAAFYKIAPANILVVHDDLDLPLGRLRLRPNGSPGGQKGVASIIKALGTDTFCRLKVGISRPGARTAGPRPRWIRPPMSCSPSRASRKRRWGWRASGQWTQSSCGWRKASKLP